MKKIKFGIGGLLMFAALLISDRAAVVAIYGTAAILHEAGHLLAAKWMRIGIREIRFDFSGARILVDEVLTPYVKEAMLAAAGPLTNLLSATVGLSWAAVGGVSPSKLFEEAGAFLFSNSISRESVVGFFVLSSLIQAGVNLLPIRGFDGGRILYCAAAGWGSPRLACTLLSASSMSAAFILWTVALYLMLRISAGLGIYTFAACVFFSLRENEQGAY